MCIISYKNVCLKKHKLDLDFSGCQDLTTKAFCQLFQVYERRRRSCHPENKNSKQTETDIQKDPLCRSVFNIVTKANSPLWKKLTCNEKVYKFPCSMFLYQFPNAAAICVRKDKSATPSSPSCFSPNLEINHVIVLFILFFNLFC